MSKKSELIKNTFIILLGKFCTRFLSFFLLPLYTSVLSSKQYGVVDLITTYITLLVPIISLQLEMAVFREIIDYRKNVKKLKEIISSSLFTIFIQFLICLFLYFIIGLFINIPYKSYIVFSVVCSLLSNLLLQVARGKGDNVGYSIASLIAGGMTIILNILFLLIFRMKIEGMLLASALGNFFAMMYLFIRCRIWKYVNYKYYSKDLSFKLLKYSMPLVPNGLIWWIINVSDRTLISIFLGTSSNGIYAVSNKFSLVLIQIYNIFNLSWTESASLHINDNDKNEFFSKTFNEIIKIFFSMCILIVGIIPFVFKFLVNKNFSDAYYYVPSLLVGTMFNIIVTFIGGIYVAKKLTKEIAITSFWSGIINILFNVILIKKIGIYAAAISTIISFIVMSIYRYVDIQKYVKLKFNYKQIFILVIIFIIECIVYYLRNRFLMILVLVIVSSIIIYLNVDYIKIIFNMINHIKKKK